MNKSSETLNEFLLRYENWTNTYLDDAFGQESKEHPILNLSLETTLALAKDAIGKLIAKIREMDEQARDDDEKDLAFLKDMLERFTEGIEYQDQPQRQVAFEMVGHWIDELEEKLCVQKLDP